MSHDQKPLRVRVVKNAAAPERRRRRDPGSPAVAVIDTASGSGDPGDVPTPRKLASLLPAAMFMLAAGAGGAIVALLGVS